MQTSYTRITYDKDITKPHDNMNYREASDVILLKRWHQTFIVQIRPFTILPIVTGPIPLPPNSDNAESPFPDTSERPPYRSG